MSKETNPKERRNLVDTYIHFNKATGWGLVAVGLIFTPALVFGGVNLAQGYGAEYVKKRRAEKRSGTVVQFPVNHGLPESDSRQRQLRAA